MYEKSYNIKYSKYEKSYSVDRVDCMKNHIRVLNNNDTTA